MIIFEIRKGSQSPQAKLTADKVRAMRREYASGVTNGELARKYKISTTRVHEIVKRKAWAHI